VKHVYESNIALAFFLERFCNFKDTAYSCRRVAVKSFRVFKSNLGIPQLRCKTCNARSPELKPKTKEEVRFVTPAVSIAKAIYSQHFHNHMFDKRQ